MCVVWTMASRAPAAAPGCNLPRATAFSSDASMRSHERSSGARSGS